MTSPPERRASSDERGAIMVVGIFMCAAVVGAMWYLAGIGDALVFRERVQEASDAGAFSGAALHARGMNLIVLLNLVMACILGIRVALKAVQLTLVVLGAIFAILGIFIQVFAALATPCIEAAGEMQSLISELKEPINEALKALSKAEIGIARVVPAASCLGGKFVADRYSPPVDSSFVGISVDTVEKGLPLKEGTADRLCYEAGKSVGALMGWLLDKVGIPGLKGGMAGDKFGSVMGSIASAGSPYFCEMGSGGKPPNVDGILSENAEDKCKKDREKKQQDFNDANGAWLQKCNEYKVGCFERDEWGNETPFMTNTEGLKPAQRTELNDKLATRDAKKDDLDAFNFGKCKDDEMKFMKKKVAEGMGPPSATSNGNDMTPKMVIPEWSNGINTTQVISWLSGDTSFMRFGTQGVRVAEQRRNKADLSLPPGAGFGFAQAEYFYDCSGAWKGDDCNGDRERHDNEGAMWHFKWRARLRRYNSPYGDLSTAIELPTMLPAHGALLKKASEAKLITWTSPGNIGLKSELYRFANPADQKSVAIH
jgi:hypothetical protein